MRDVAQPVEGPNLDLRLVTPDDAAYIHALRVDPAYNAHLSAVTGGVAEQRAWIESYKRREAEGREFYFLIVRKDATRCGVVRAYDLERDSFTWGSWILDANKPPKAALESAVLIYIFGFERLGLGRSVFDVRKENVHTLRFHDRFGAVRTGEAGLDVHFEYRREWFRRKRAEFLDIVSR